MSGDTKMTVPEALRTLCGNGLISAFDLQFAEALARSVSAEKRDDIDLLRVISALASHLPFTRQAACTDIESLDIELIFTEQEYPADSRSLNDTGKLESLEENRKAKDLIGKVLGKNRSTVMNGLCRKYPEIIYKADNFDAEIPFVPLIWIAPRLYLHRFWCYEKELAEILVRIAGEPDRKPVSESEIREYFQLFGKNDLTDNGQWKAVQLALKKKLSVITGGPGTGKTTIVSTILALTLKENPDTRITLCAPTGKAQARMLESIRDMENQDAKIYALPASTIHRLLKYNYHTGKFRKDAESPIETDLLIVDESSMVSLPLMVRLMRAVPKDAKIILLGDADQLASVETGAVLADICERASQADSRWKDNVARLTKNYRFRGPDTTEILQLKETINTGNADKVIEQLSNTKEGPVVWGLFNGKRLPSGPDELLEALNPLLDLWKNGYLKAKDITTAIEQFKLFQVLCSHRGGLFGANSLNKLIRKALLGKTKSYDKGIPLMIIRNNYEHMLFNGEVGLCWPDDNGIMKVYFPDPEQPGELRKFSPSILPEHEDAFAMTVHKAQGSGFREVLLILPDVKESPILTRELLYTGITRTEKKVTVWAKEHTLRSAINRKTVRASGLKERLIK